jgi:RNA polymerase sigma-70 factor (ECF subfamily)
VNGVLRIARNAGGARADDQVMLATASSSHRRRYRSDSVAPMAVAPEREGALVAALQRGDEAAFLELVDRHHALMVRVAQGYVRSRAVAEEVAQEAWLGVLHGILRFESRSTLKTWIFRIVVNRAKTRAERERRTVPFSALEGGDDESAVSPSRFLDAAHPRWPGHWAQAPQRWDELPEECLLSRETLALARSTIDALPLRQREVILLRDVDGWSPEEVCDALELSEGNQRVLLHRARTRVRAALEEHLAEESP